MPADNTKSTLPRVHDGDFEHQAQSAEQAGDWAAAASYYARAVGQRCAELALINSVQEGLTSRLEMQAIYNLVGDKLRDTFDAQVVMISQYDPQTMRVYHHYAIERGVHLNLISWSPIDSSRLRIVQTRKPYMINAEEIIRVVTAGSMAVVPGTELPQTWLGVPWLVGEEVRGIVSLQNLDKENAFSQSDIDLLATLTNAMSLSLENARLLKETQRLLQQLEGEMQIARQTQQSILPRRLPRHAGYDFGALVIPARAVGGDFYDFIKLPGQRLGIVIGDVSDKGMPAALFMALTFSLIRAESGQTTHPRTVLSNVNRYLLNMNTLGNFVTILYSILDLKSGMLTYTRAGHPSPIILDAYGEPQSIQMDEGQPLGVFDALKFDEQQVVIPPGGLLLGYSDGLNEAADENGVEFGVRRIEQVLAQHRAGSAQAVCEGLWTAVQTHSRELPNQDDFTTVVVKRGA